MMVRVSEWTFSQMSIWVVSQKFTLLSHVWGQRRFLVSGNILSKIFHHGARRQTKENLLSRHILYSAPARQTDTSAIQNKYQNKNKEWRKWLWKRIWKNYLHLDAPQPWHWQPQDALQHIQQRFRSRHHRWNLSGTLPRTKKFIM